MQKALCKLSKNPDVVNYDLTGGLVIAEGLGIVCKVLEAAVLVCPP